MRKLPVQASKGDGDRLQRMRWRERGAKANSKMRAPPLTLSAAEIVTTGQGGKGGRIIRSSKLDRSVRGNTLFASAETVAAAERVQPVQSSCQVKERREENKEGKREREKGQTRQVLEHTNSERVTAANTGVSDEDEDDAENARPTAETPA